jgi:hypothetical protein
MAQRRNTIHVSVQNNIAEKAEDFQLKLIFAIAALKISRRGRSDITDRR